MKHTLDPVISDLVAAFGVKDARGLARVLGYSSGGGLSNWKRFGGIPIAKQRELEVLALARNIELPQSYRDYLAAELAAELDAVRSKVEAA